MRTIDLLDDSFPHGTPRGYADGCRGAACPAVISCKDVHRRYSGDWGFRKLVDAGLSLEEILAKEAADKAAARERARAAAARERQAAEEPTPKPAKRHTPTKAPRKPSRPATPPKPPQATVPRPQVLPVTATEPAPVARALPADDAWVQKARQRADGLSPEEAAVWLRQVDEYAAAAAQHQADLSRWKREHRIHRQALKAALQALDVALTAQGTGLSLGGAIAAAVDQARTAHAAAAAGLEELSARPAPPQKPRLHRTGAAAVGSRQLRPHGTYAARARGCDCPECIEAGKRYHREWIANRRQQQIPLEHHGTAYGWRPREWWGFRQGSRYRRRW